MQLLGRARPVELSVAAPDLLGVGGAVLGLRRRLLVVERGVDQIGRQLGGPGKDDSGVIVDPDLKPLLRGGLIPEVAR